MSLVDLIGGLKRVATTNGGEWAGPCPFCRGRDRFRVWPEEDGGRYWCRGCQKSGDAIQYLRDFRGLSFKEACFEMGREPLNRPQEHREVKSPLPSLAWQARAGAFLVSCQAALKKNRAALNWLRGRGLRGETIHAAGLGWNPVLIYEPRDSWGLEPSKDEKGNVKGLWLPKGLIIPLIEGGQVLRLRVRRPVGEPRYVVVSGSDMRPMVFHRKQGAFVIVESELDAILVNQEAEDLAGVVSLGNAQARPDTETDKVLRGAASILVSLDFDEAGGRASWQFWLSNYPNAKRWPTPKGKDPGDYYQQGGNIRAWIEAGFSNEKPQNQNDEAVSPFPLQWLQKYDDERLERLAIMTVDGWLSDQEAMRLLN